MNTLGLTDRRFLVGIAGRKASLRAASRAGAVRATVSSLLVIRVLVV
jgi:hypothetical protein